VAECFHTGTALQYELILFPYHTGLLCYLCFLEWARTQLLLNRSHFIQSSWGERLHSSSFTGAVCTNFCF